MKQLASQSTPTRFWKVVVMAMVMAMAPPHPSNSQEKNVAS